MCSRNLKSSMDSIDAMNEYYERGIHVEFLNRLERAIGLTETTAEEWSELDKKDFCHLFLLAETRILRLTEENQTLKNGDGGV